MLEGSFSEIIELLWIADVESMLVVFGELLEVLEPAISEDVSDSDPKMDEMLGEVFVVPKVIVESRGMEFRDDVLRLSSVVIEDGRLMLGAIDSDEGDIGETEISEESIELVLVG